MSRLQGARVVLVEDNVDLAENVIEILEDEGAEVRHFSSGAETRAAVAADFDIALVDVRLPDGTGLQLVPDLRSIGDGLAEVLLMTGNANLDDAVAAVSAGAYAYIIKPFDPDDLIAAVERAVRQVRSSRQARSLASEVQRREAELRTLVDAVQALLLVLDEEGRVIQANPAVAALTGVETADLLGANWIEEFVPEEDRAGAERAFAQLMAGASRVPHENRVVCRRDGEVSERVVSWQSSAYVKENSSVLIYASGLDVTEVKQLEARTRLAERLAAVGTLAAGLAHEIRNPLNSAKLQLHLLERRIGKIDVGSAVVQPVGLVQSEIERLSKLVQDFLDFARPVDLALTEVDLVPIVARVVELERHAARDGVTLAVTTPADPVVVEADPDKIQQVILNLIRNAVEAVEDGGRVEVELSAELGGATIAVRDNGPGIAPEVLKRLFEPFYSTKATGTGLGMAICHSLVTQHGGDIAVRSESGAEFLVSLPRRAPAA